MFYKQKYKMRPSQGLNSLFREDTDSMKSETEEWSYLIKSGYRDDIWNEKGILQFSFLLDCYFSI